MIDYLFESYHITGTYCCIIPSSKSKDDIFRFCKESEIPNMIDPRDYHCTIVYSENPAEDLLSEEFEFPIKALFKGFRLLGKENNILVMEIYCPEATRLHNLFKEKYGATHSFPEYIAHITVANNFQGQIPNSVFMDEIEFTGLKFEELK